MRRVAFLVVALAGAALPSVVGGGVAQAAGATATGLAPLVRVDRDVPSTSGLTSVAINASGQAVVGWTGVPEPANSAGPFSPAAQVAFRSADGTWSAPERLSPADQGGGNVQVAIDASGTATIAWTEVKESVHTVRMARHTAAGLTANQTFAGPVGGAQRLRLAANASGDAILTWSGDCSKASCGSEYGSGPFSNGDIYAATRPGNGEFGPPQTLSDPGPLHRGAPVASVGAGGAIAVAWEEGTTTALHLRVRQQPAGGTFGPARELASAQASSLSPNVVVAPSGAATVTWWQPREMRAARVATDGSVSPVQTLPGTYTTGFSQGETALAVDSAGRVTAAWITNDGLWTASAAPGAEFAAGVQLDPFATAQANPPALAADPDGGVLLAWRNDQSLKAAWRPAGETAFRPTGTIDGGTIGSAPRAALAGRHALLAGGFGATSDRISLFATVGDPALVAPPVPATPAPTPAPTPTPTDTTAPQLKITAASVVTTKTTKPSGKRVTRKTVRAEVSTSEATKVVVTVTKRTAGVRRGKACVAAKPAASNGAKPRACTRTLTVGKPVRTAVPTGSATLELGTAPAKGAYEIVLTGTDAAGNIAAPAKRKLTVR